jgi:hypothetical protein
LYGCPVTVGNNFTCENVGISDFVGGPTEVHGMYIVNNVARLDSFKGLPKILQLLDLAFANIHPDIKFDGLPEEASSIIFPESIVDYHDIHKHLKKVKTYIRIHANPKEGTRWLSLNLIEGSPNIRISDPAVQYVYREFDKIQNKQNDGYIDLLLLQQMLIDAGYPNLAKL